MAKNTVDRYQNATEMIRDMDYHNWSLDSEVYGGLTYKNIIELAIFIRKNTDYDNEYYVDMMCD